MHREKRTHLPTVARCAEQPPRTELAHLFFVPPTLNFELKFREHKFFMPEA
jgi:hypothetical protein